MIYLIQVDTLGFETHLLDLNMDEDVIELIEKTFTEHPAVYSEVNTGEMDEENS